jgi:hypothetical protein
VAARPGGAGHRALAVQRHFGRSSHAFSLTDVTVTLALMFSSGADAVAGVTPGAGAALALRRLPPVKLAFNVARRFGSPTASRRSVHDFLRFGAQRRRSAPPFWQLLTERVRSPAGSRMRGEGCASAARLTALVGRFSYNRAGT